MTSLKFQQIVAALCLVVLLIGGIEYVNAQDSAPQFTVILTFGGQTCTLSSDPSDALVLVESPTQTDTSPDVESDAIRPLVLTDDCLTLIQALPKLASGTYWFSITLPGDTRRLALSTVEDDSNLPQLDSRGQYFGCNVQYAGQTPPCRVLVEIDDTSYLVEIPLEEDFETDVITNVISTPSAPQENLPGLNAKQQEAVNVLREVATVTVNRDGTLTATIQISESSLNHTLDLYAPLAGYTADDLVLDIVPDGFIVTADNSFLNGNPGRLVFHMVAILDSQPAALRTDWADFNGMRIDASLMQKYDPMISSFVMGQVASVLNPSKAFDYAISTITLSETEMELVAVVTFRE